MFKDIRVACLDHDRTLFSHDYPRMGEVHLSYQEECLMQLRNQKEYQKGDKPLKCMQWCVEQLKANGAVIYVLTHEIFNLRDKYKSRMAREHYGIENYITVDSPEHKVDMMLALSKLHNVAPRNILFVDDNMHTIYNACAEGFVGMHISNIAQIYESIGKEV